MAVAPPPAWGMISTLPPRRKWRQSRQQGIGRRHTLYLPIHVDGALFSVGDGHGAQGDGEVCITAIETGLIGTFELHVRPTWRSNAARRDRDAHDHMAFDPDLDDCVVIALRQMIDLIVKRAGITREQAYTLCSLAADLRVTQLNGRGRTQARNIVGDLIHPIRRRSPRPISRSSTKEAFDKTIATQIEGASHSIRPSSIIRTT